MTTSTLHSSLLHRREWLRVGALGTLGLTLPYLLRAESTGRGKQPKSCIFIFAFGGPPQHETFDMKPNAPAEIRGLFKPIQTSVPGLHVCEHLPRLGQLAHRYSLIRSATHKQREHNPAGHYALTGRPPSTSAVGMSASRKDWPALGSILSRYAPPTTSVPSYVLLPKLSADVGVLTTPGQHAGWMSLSFDPLVIQDDPSKPDFKVSALSPQSDVSSSRLQERRELLRAMNDPVQAWSDQAGVRNLDGYYQKAFDLVGSAASKQAFDVRQEAESVRRRYGMNRHGQSVLLARRLIEAGVRLVLVNDTEVNGANKLWDTHSGNFTGMKQKLPETDAALSALLEDLHERGLLDSTLVVFMGEFGRTPKTNQSRTAGRDHWPDCYSLLLAGGGVRGGHVYGASDAIGAYPKDKPCTPEDIHATIYHAMGLAGDTVLTDAIGREIPLYSGKPIVALF